MNELKPIEQLEKLNQSLYEVKKNIGSLNNGEKNLFEIVEKSLQALLYHYED